MSSLIPSELCTEEIDMCTLQKSGQAEVVQDTIYCVLGCRSFLPFPSFLLPSSNLTFLLVSHSSFSCTQSCSEPKRRKSMFMKAKKQMGWHMGRGLLLCLPHRAGVPSLYVSEPGMWVQFAEYQQMRCSSIPSKRSVIFKPPIPRTEGSSRS